MDFDEKRRKKKKNVASKSVCQVLSNGNLLENPVFRKYSLICFRTKVFTDCPVLNTRFLWNKRYTNCSYIDALCNGILGCNAACVYESKTLFFHWKGTKIGNGQESPTRWVRKDFCSLSLYARETILMYIVYIRAHAMDLMTWIWLIGTLCCCLRIS